MTHPAYTVITDPDGSRVEFAVVKWGAERYAFTVQAFMPGVAVPRLAFTTEDMRKVGNRFRLDSGAAGRRSVLAGWADGFPYWRERDVNVVSSWSGASPRSLARLIVSGAFTMVERKSA